MYNKEADNTGLGQRSSNQRLKPFLKPLKTRSKKQIQKGMQTLSDHNNPPNGCNPRNTAGTILNTKKIFHGLDE